MKKTMDKKITLYLIGGIIAIALIVTAIILITMVEFNTSDDTHIIADDVNPVLEIAEESSKQASTKIGMSIEEAKNEDNSISVNTEEETEVNTEDEEIQEIEEQHEDVKSSNTDVDESTDDDTEDEREKLKFSMPVVGDVIKEYAKDKLVYSETLKEWVTHSGIDIKAEKTTVVKAAERGTIKSIKNDPRFGLTVVIEHEEGFSTVYSNLLTAEFISVGEKVNKGQTIATVGNTASFEIAEEPHLHFEILKDNVQIDPNMYIK